MSPEEIIEAIKEHGLKVAPVFDADGLEYWTAGKVTLAPDGWLNNVLNRHHAKAATLEKAVQKAVELCTAPEVEEADYGVDPRSD